MLRSSLASRCPRARCLAFFGGSMLSGLAPSDVDAICSVLLHAVVGLVSCWSASIIGACNFGV